jgi:hypothetical protein
MALLRACARPLAYCCAEHVLRWLMDFEWRCFALDRDPQEIRAQTPAASVQKI